MFSLENNSNIQMRFPKSFSKPQIKAQNIESKPPRDSSLSKEPNRKVLNEVSQINSEENINKNENFLEKFEQQTKFVLNENEKLRKKIDFLSDILENTLKFEENRNVLELKTFVRMNYKRFHGILDEIYTYKEEIEKTKEQKDSLEKQINDKKNEETLRIDPKNQYNSSQTETEIKNLESNIENITKELKEIQQKNDKLREIINKKPFYREFELMGKEEEGLKKQNQSLNEMIKREQEKKKH